MSHRTSTAPLIARQDGLITRQQAHDLQLSDQVIRGLRKRGEWQLVLPGVFRVAEARPTSDQRIRAAWLWAGEPSCVSGIAAAAWWRMLEEPPVGVQLTIPRNRGLRPVPGIHIRRRYVLPVDRVFIRGICVTGPALTALQAAVQLGPAGPAVLDRALQKRIGIAEVRAAHYRNLGCHGSREAGQLLIAAADHAAAASERMFIALLKKAGITGWQVNKSVRLGRVTREIDFMFARHRIAVEIDGWAWHHTPSRFQQDRTKQNALVRNGWAVYRFTWFDFAQRPDAVIAEVRQALAAAA
ncbi:MAG: DUF559 domain-containing protein [Nakamurella sp.]